jgi:hypothetical protein
MSRASSSANRRASQDGSSVVWRYVPGTLVGSLPEGSTVAVNG